MIKYPGFYPTATDVLLWVANWAFLRPVVGDFSYIGPEGPVTVIRKLSGDYGFVQPQFYDFFREVH